MHFYLGTHEAHWLWRYDDSFFVSDVRLRGSTPHGRRARGKRPAYGRALGRWAVDSGGFSELGKHGRWTESAEDYAVRLSRYRDEIGNLDWAAPQDWMCEDHLLAKTGLTVHEHQRRTIDSVIRLRILSRVHIIPVLQGSTASDYYAHARFYESAGFDLKNEPTVGIGSVCRRQTVTSILDVVRDLASDGIKLHVFGFKITGLPVVKMAIKSADSLAWSKHAVNRPPRPEHKDYAHRSCANCYVYAQYWRRELLYARLKDCS